MTEYDWRKLMERLERIEAELKQLREDLDNG